MEVKNLFNDMFSKIIAPSMKKAGFIKERHSFYYLFEGNWGIIDFQKSTKSDSNKIIFTVNAGVASKRILDFLSQKEHNKRPDIWDTQWRVRVGHLMPENDDLWWTIEEGVDIDNLGQTVLEKIMNFAVPGVRKLIRDEALRDLWLSGRSPALTDFQRLLYLAVLLKQIGPQEIFETAIYELKQVSANKPSAITAEIFINKLRSS